MPVTIRAFSHIVLPVADLDAALAFYRDLLGLEVVMRLDPDNSGPEGSIAAGLDIAGMLVPGGTMLELVQGLQEPRAGSTVVALNVADVKAAQQQVEAAAAQLPPRQRAIFFMKHFEDMSHGDIARVLGRSEGAVRANYFHAVRKLRQYLSQTGLLDPQP